MKKETRTKTVVSQNVFGNVRYEFIEVTHIKCSTQEFTEMLNAREYEIVAVERNEFSEKYFKLDSRYLIFNVQFGIESATYADSLVKENVRTIIKIVE